MNEANIIYKNQVQGKDKNFLEENVLITCVAQRKTGTIYHSYGFLIYHESVNERKKYMYLDV